MFAGAGAAFTLLTLFVTLEVNEFIPAPSAIVTEIIQDLAKTLATSLADKSQNDDPVRD